MSEIGMKRGGTVILASANVDWAPYYRQEEELIRTIVPANRLSLHHIGSTSVPGLIAKPIIDILGEWTEAICEFDAYQSLFESAGFTWRGEYGIPGRRFLFRTDSAQEITFCHLHVFSSTDDQIRRHLLFRDFLRVNDAVRDQYAELKQSLRMKFPNSRDEYTEAKSGFISEIIEKASNSRGFPGY